MGLKGAARPTSTKGLPFQNYKGRLTYVGGFSGNGKTSLVLNEVPEPFLFFCTDVSNPTVAKLPWVTDSDEDLDHVLDNPTKTFAVRCYKKSKRILELCRDHRRAVVLDEIANLFFDAKRQEELLEWAREVRYCDGGLQAWATSQRAAADVRPGIYFAARTIKWVGPLFDDASVKALFSHRNKNWDRAEFEKSLGNLVPYHWQRQNDSESVLVVKDVE